MIIRNISGVRGLVDTDLTTDTVKAYARAFHIHVDPGLIMLGRDSRPSGEDLLDAFTEELIGLGRDLIVCGIVPTPTVQFMVEKSEASGGVIITASHNPIEWNGLKFVREDSTFFHPNDCENLFEIVDKNSVIENAQDPGMRRIRGRLQGPGQGCQCRHNTAMPPEPLMPPAMPPEPVMPPEPL